MTDANRTMTLTRVIAAPVSAVWDAWTDPEKLPRWWGPRGFSCETQRIDLREGGDWVFDMIGPDGTRYPNQHVFLVREENARIVYRLNQGAGGPEHATVTVTLEDLGPDGTRLTLSMLFTDAAGYEAARNAGAEALGLQTLDKLAEAVGA